MEVFYEISRKVDAVDAEMVDLIDSIEEACVALQQNPELPVSEERATDLFDLRNRIVELYSALEELVEFSEEVLENNE
jgi:hypothetical protein